jgi:hypothetical protein
MATYEAVKKKPIAANTKTRVKNGILIHFFENKFFTI